MNSPQNRLYDWVNNNFNSVAEFARFINIKPQTANYYLKLNGVLPLEFILKLETKGFDKDYYLTGEKSNIKPIHIDTEINIPIYDISVYANVGGGITEINQIPSYEMKMTNNYKDCIGFKAIGDSMIGDDIKENDVLIVNPQIKPRDNDLLVVNLNGLLLVKRVTIKENGKWELQSSKKGVAPIIEYDQDTLMYIGKVIEIRKFLI